MTSYQDLKDKPKRFHSLTGYTPEEFSAIAPTFSKCFLEFVETNTLDGERRKKRKYCSYKNSFLPSIEDKLLFIFIYLRKAVTQDVLGELFGVSQPVANKWIHRLLPIVNRALAALGELPSREPDPSTFDTPGDTSSDNQVSNHFFFRIALSVRYSVPKTHKDKRLIIVVKRNNIPTRITWSLMLRAKLCY